MVGGCRLSWASASLQQTQRSVHNSNSCSCILIQSAGLSLKRPIFLHFRNYIRARDCGPDDPRGWSLVRVGSPSSPARSLRISRIPALLPGAEYQTKCFSSNFHLQTLCLYLNIQRCTFLDDSKMNFVHWSNLWKKARICSQACCFLPYFLNFTFQNRAFLSLFFSEPATRNYFWIKQRCFLSDCCSSRLPT